MTLDNRTLAEQGKRGYAAAKGLYPADFNPPNRGTCEVCHRETRALGERWLVRCPEHWQQLASGRA